MRPLALAIVVVPAIAAAQPYTPAPPADVSGYSATVMPCKVSREPRTSVRCSTGPLAGDPSLRELSILRNTIYARWGWDGYRKAWLRDYFHAQKWFKPNPNFSYKLLSDADRKNAHFIATREQSFTSLELMDMRDRITARKQQTADDKVELGLLARAMGEFALDSEKRDAAASSLDRVLKVDELRQLSLRDLRLLRNTIYARHGRPFKSQILQDHFDGMDWYKKDAGYTDKLLTANDQRNIALIRSVENEFGGPLTDEDWLTEPATDAA
jgi:hypothetical protein